MKIVVNMKHEQVLVIMGLLESRSKCSFLYHKHSHPIRIDHIACLKDDKANKDKDSLYEVSIAIDDFDNSLDDEALYYYKTSINEVVMVTMKYQFICHECHEPIDSLLAEDYIRHVENRRKHNLKRLCIKCLNSCTKCGKKLELTDIMAHRYRYLDGKKISRQCESCKK